MDGEGTYHVHTLHRAPIRKSAQPPDERCAAFPNAWRRNCRKRDSLPPSSLSRTVTSTQTRVTRMRDRCLRYRQAEREGGQGSCPGGRALQGSHTMNRVDIVLIDSDNARRAHIAAMAECIGASVATYASRGICDIDCPTAALYLIERQAAAPHVPRGRASAGARVVVFGSGPFEGRTSDTAGAADYLAWPFGPGAIRRSLAAALIDADDANASAPNGSAGWSSGTAGGMPWRRLRALLFDQPVRRFS